MKIKRIRKLRVNCTDFVVTWDKKTDGSCLDYYKHSIKIGVKDCDELRILNNVLHELIEICAIEMCVRFRRPDCQTDFIFVYDHRQHQTMTEMLAGLLEQFIK